MSKPRHQIQVIKLHEAAYDSHVWMIVHENRSAVRQFVLKKFGTLLRDDCLPEFGGCYFHVVSPTIHERIHIMWLQRFDGSVADQGLLHHELLHMTIAILRQVGIHLSSDSEEAYTWLHQRLVVDALKYLKKFYKGSR